MSKGDPSILYYFNDNILQGLIAVFAQDFLWSGINDFQTDYFKAM